MTPGTGSAARVAVLALIVLATAFAIVWTPRERTNAVPRITGEIQHFSLERNPRVPDVPAFLDARGRETTLAAFRGKVVVLNFWATWCAPCIHEMPSLDRLAERFRGRPFALVALNEDREGAAKAGPFLAGLKLRNVALYTDPQSRVQWAFKVGSLPTTIVFDAAGREVGRLARPADWSSPEAIALIEHFIAKAR